MIKVLNIFDFDGTLFGTLDPSVGPEVYESINNSKWPYDNWYETPESLDLSLPLIPNYSVFSDFDESKRDINAITVVLTGRIDKLKNHIISILDSYSLKPDHVFLSDDGFTLPFKEKKILELLNKYPSVKEINMWEDKDYFADYYENLGKKINIPIFVNRIKINNGNPNVHNKNNGVKDVKSAGLIILKEILNEPNVLLLETFNKEFDLTKGKLEANESIIECAIRECFEESNISNLEFRFGKKAFKIFDLVLYIAFTKENPKIKKNPETNEYEHKNAVYIPLEQAELLIKPGLRTAITWARQNLDTH